MKRLDEIKARLAALRDPDDAVPYIVWLACLAEDAEYLAGEVERHEELWLEFINPNHPLCGLCGNCGLVDTRGKVVSPAGVECGVTAYCICPNGRVLKARKK